MEPNQDDEYGEYGSEYESEYDNQCHECNYVEDKRRRKGALIFAGIGALAGIVYGVYYAFVNYQVVSILVLAALIVIAVIVLVVRRNIKRKKWAEDLRARVCDESRMLVRVYREHYAKARCSEVLEKLRYLWFEEREKIRRARGFIPYLKRRYPDVIEWLEARREIVDLAARFAVEPAKRLTTEEWRENDIRYIRTGARDAEEHARVFKEESFKILDQEDAEIEAIEANPHLTPEQKEKRIRQLKIASQIRLKELLGDHAEEYEAEPATIR